MLFGFLAGYFRDTWIDKLVTTLVDHRRVGAALLARHGAGHHLLGAARLAAGRRRRARRLSDWAWDWAHIQHLVLPAVTMSVIPMGIVTRTVRALVGDMLSQEFVDGAARQGPHEQRRVPCTSSRTPRRPRSP